MKTVVNLVKIILIVLVQLLYSEVLFYEDFEANLDRWTGKSNGEHSGKIV